MARTTNVVNLDALIKRADLAEIGEASDDIPTLYINGLEPKGLLYPALRKPDFQRETAVWSPEQVSDLIATFLRRELIPAVILWRSGKHVFVVDGAHRLSALIAWVHNDYGDGTISQDFFGSVLPEDQVKAARRTRDFVDGTIGSYLEHRDAIERPDRARPEVLERAQRFGWQNIEVQWIRGADHAKAEKSFFRINQGGTKIEPTEQRILLARTSATALASRAILRGGSGHNYWDKFSAATQRRIEELGREIFALMFNPNIEQPIRTLDLPMAGQGYGPHALPFVFDLVNIANKVQVADSSNKRVKEEDGFIDDLDGSETVKYLTEVRRLLWRFCSNNPSSLGLHPVLYFYSGSGVFQPAALLSFVVLMKEWETADYRNFVEVRSQFEEFLLANRNITEAIRKLGTGNRSRPRIIGLYRIIINQLREGKTSAEVANALRETKDYGFLIDASDEAPPMLALDGGSFSRETKGAAYIAEALPHAQKCPSCGGLMHRNGMQVGHRRHRRDGGSGRQDNAMMQHPFCNSTVHN
ncbi:DUF262 domain-containing protein [Sphingomonas montanisoli]|uniref:DUF262 domain-containing protein n=1 Tax=Sphingomonas montanisoli TaxID=2606412 RepID=A0A5D9CCF2_9SPHN|nr:DUF262 domain-containing protein [Sphingomonas montanisoli]